MRRTWCSTMLIGWAVLGGTWLGSTTAAWSQNSILVRDRGSAVTDTASKKKNAEPPRRDSAEGFLTLAGPTTAAADQPAPAVKVPAPTPPAAASNSAAVPPQLVDAGDSHRRVVSQVALQATVDSPKHMHVGRDAPLQIHLKNEGDSPSKAARVFVGLPPSVELISASPDPLAQAGDRVEFAVDALAAGGTHQLDLVVRPTSLAQLDFQVLTMPVLEQSVSIVVAGPSLQVETLCPREAPLRSQFIQGIMIENPSPDEVCNVAVTASIPEGLNIAKLNRDAEIDMESRVVTWRLPRLAPQAREAFQFIAVAEAAGAQLTKVTVTSAGTAAQTFELTTQVASPAAGSSR